MDGLRAAMSASTRALTDAPSPSLHVARTNAIRLYRHALRSVPQIQKDFTLDIPQSTMRRRLRADFERYKAVDDSVMVDRLVYKGKLDLEEFQQLWKSKSHAIDYFGDARFDEGWSGAPASPAAVAADASSRASLRAERQRWLRGELERCRVECAALDDAALLDAYVGADNARMHADTLRARLADDDGALREQLRVAVYRAKLEAEVVEHMPALVADDLDDDDAQRFARFHGDYDPNEYDFKWAPSV